MDPKKLEDAAAYMHENWHLITGDESDYKPRIASKMRPVFEAAARGEASWPALLKATYKDWSTQIGWRTATDFLNYSLAHPVAVGKAVSDLQEPQDADRFWEIALTPVGGRERLRDDFPQLAAPGALASIVSLVLFSRNHENYPIYRAQISGAPLTSLLGEPLDKRSLGSTLKSFYLGLERLRALLKERGLDVRNNLDVQGVLWV